MEYTVWSCGEGWYNFKNLPPHPTDIVSYSKERYCGTDEIAVKMARCRLRDNSAVIIIKVRSGIATR